MRGRQRKRIRKHQETETEKDERQNESHPETERMIEKRVSLWKDRDRGKGANG